MTTKTTSYTYQVNDKTKGVVGGEKSYSPGLFARYGCKIRPYIIDEYNITRYYKTSSDSAWLVLSDGSSASNTTQIATIS
jgi:hypothetical protein